MPKLAKPRRQRPKAALTCPDMTSFRWPERRPQRLGPVRRRPTRVGLLNLQTDASVLTADQPGPERLGLSAQCRAGRR